MQKKAKNAPKSKREDRKSRAKREKDYMEKLATDVQNFDVEELKSITKFSELPLSSATLKGLKSSHYTTMTDIQVKSIVPALQGHDILGAARTGSGKTLAFLIPVLEFLYRQTWTSMDGLGALVISPTRDLAIQIFEVLRKIGRYHGFSAGLVIGGKDSKDESERISKLNIIIGTPGRILHHMHKSPDFDVSSLGLLVLDEADRILDLGFRHQLNSIVQDLPTQRQTLLFSATQTKTISDLARLSLVDPMYISAHEEKTATPEQLEQFYVVTDLDQKLNMLYSFIRSHTKQKLLVFFSSAKQVRYVYETFRKKQPGIPLLHLHGNKKLTARKEAIDKFSSQQHACLFTTDVVARGIDFPTVDWVIQVDCPEDVATYVHRVGRSARFNKSGHALLFLTPQERPGMLAEIEAKKIPITEQHVKQSRLHNIKKDLQAMCFKDPELKYLGQKAFISYVRSVHIQHNKEIFKIEDLPLEKFAESLGLPGAPQVKKLGNLQKAKELKNTPRALLRLQRGEDSDEEPQEKQKKQVVTKNDRIFNRKNQDVLSEHYSKLVPGFNDDNDDEDDGFMAVKRSDHLIDDEELPNLNEPESKRAAKRALSKKLSAKERGNPTKLVFDDEGNAHELYELEDEEDFKAAGDAKDQQKKYLEQETKVMAERDVEDKELAREKRLEKKRRRQEIERRLREEEEFGDEDGGVEVVLGGEENEEEEEALPDLDRDMESSDEERPAKRSRFQPSESEDEGDGVIEVEEPETLEDLEALSAKLLRR
ncbi:ATP-dependent RNA helicase Hca4p [Trichomonascus vanleenenianus]|uniref:RNA-dependent ATPase HCA4 n=1 Tax=Trichomonascus vanleenenianus TaxID=2268995 RepID=UPI003ECB8AC4